MQVAGVVSPRPFIPHCHSSLIIPAAQWSVVSHSGGPGSQTPSDDHDQASSSDSHRLSKWLDSFLVINKMFSFSPRQLEPEPRVRLRVHGQESSSSPKKVSQGLLI